MLSIYINYLSQISGSIVLFQSLSDNSTTNSIKLMFHRFFDYSRYRRNRLNTRGLCDENVDLKLNKLIDAKLAERGTTSTTATQHIPTPQQPHSSAPMQHGHGGGTSHMAGGAPTHAVLPHQTFYGRFKNFVTRRPFLLMSMGLGTAAYAYVRLYPDRVNKLLGRQTGGVRENLIIKSESDELNSYKFSISKAIDGSKTSQSYSKSVSPSLDKSVLAGLQLSDEQQQRLTAIGDAYDAKNRVITGDLCAGLRSMEVLRALDHGMQSAQEGGEQKKYQLNTSMDGLLKAKVQLDMEYLAQVTTILNVEQRKKWVQYLEKGRDSLFPWTDMLAQRPVAFPHPDRPKVFVLTFEGDLLASQVKKLRREVTAVLQGADPTRGDQVVVLLNSGGGTVNGYGLGAAQLQRIKASGLPLTVCVDEVAASGGYLMACVADRIVVSPFAMIGSIGVISTVPNFYERLKREGIEVEDVTAGQFKRTLTPYKKITPADKAKMRQDVEDIHRLFKDFVAQYRPHLDMAEVGTGEVWLGTLALQKGLCDELRTSDDFLLECLAQGNEVYRVRYGVRATGLRGVLQELEEERGKDEASAGSLLLGLITALNAVASALSLLGSGSSSLPPKDRVSFEPHLYSGDLDHTRYER